VPPRDSGTGSTRRAAIAAFDGDGPLDRTPADAAAGGGTGFPSSLGLPAGLPLLPAAWSLSTLAGLTVFAVILGRRGIEGPAIRVEGIGSPLGGVAPPPAGGDVAGAFEPDDGDPSPPDESMRGGPRYLGPSGPSAGRPALRFDRPPGHGVERRTVSYRGVRVGDGSDGVRSVEVGRLERGDEVDVLEWRAGTALVRAPGGLEGWIHGATIIGGYATDDA
jgi:hypothetical protein